VTSEEESDELSNQVQEVWDEYLWGRFERVQKLTEVMDDDPLASVEAATLASEIGRIIMELDHGVLMNLTTYIGAMYASLRARLDED
jgi:hypothetical protein